jgi:DNA invertase Pin-like site-specific DNA recombinase
MFRLLGVFAEFERSMIRERVMAGLSRAKADGIELGRRRLEAPAVDLAWACQRAANFSRNTSLLVTGP